MIIRKTEMAKTFHPRSRALSVFMVLAAAMIITSSCKYEFSILSYDSEKAYKGLTLLAPYRGFMFHIIDMDGNAVCEFPIMKNCLDRDFEVLGDGGIMFLGNWTMYRVNLQGTFDWIIPAPNIHHSFTVMPNGNIMYLFYYKTVAEGWDLPLLCDGIREVNPSTGEIVWLWRSSDHISTDDYCPEHMMVHYLQPKYYDWTHANTVIYREEESAVYMNFRHLDRFVKIAYPSGEIIWSMGMGGDFGEGLFSHSHDPEILDNGNILTYDNGNHRFPVEYSRAVEIAYDPELGWAEEVWAWPTEPLFFDSSMGDANRLPNGNTLITSPHLGGIIEVTPGGEVVWNMVFEHPTTFNPILYKSERVLASDLYHR